MKLLTLILLVGVGILLQKSFSEKREMQKQKAYATPVSDAILAFEEQEISPVAPVMLPVPECSCYLQNFFISKKDSGQRYSPT